MSEFRVAGAATERSVALVAIARKLREATANLHFSPPVAFVYRPLEYAWAPHEQYLVRYGSYGADTLLIGMNPGPFGMAQTGIPFGDVGFVRDWLRITGPVGRPVAEHPKRLVAGFAAKRGEVSGRRLWGWAQDVYREPERFFARFFVWNYCPLAFIETSGRNRTPDKLPIAERSLLYTVCDEALQRLIDCLQPKRVIGVGRFAFDRLRALPSIDAILGIAPHPSPASPAANRGWRALFERSLTNLGTVLR